MEARFLNDNIAVCGQIGPEHVPAIAEAGFSSIVCNRPDTEDGAVEHGMIEEAAKAAGLRFRFIPVISGAITEENVSEMDEALASLPTPVLAYCRSGSRCTNLVMMIQDKRAGEVGFSR